MPLELFGCPSCKVMVRRPAHLEVGATIRCPGCGHEFAVPSPAEAKAVAPPAPVPPAQPTAAPLASLALVGCPACKVMVRRPAHLEAGETIRCPGCGHTFVEPSSGAKAAPVEAPPRAEEPLRAEPGPVAIAPAPPPERPVAEDRKEEEDEDHPALRKRPTARPSGFRVDLKDWFGYASAGWSEVMWPAAGYLLVVWLFLAGMQTLLNDLARRQFGGRVVLGEQGGNLFVSEAVGLALSVLGYALVEAPVLAGLTVVALAQLKGEVWTFGELFGGFRRYGTVAVLAFVSRLSLLLPLTAAVTAAQHFGERARVQGQAGMPDETWICLGLGLLWLPIYLALWVRLFFFAWPAAFDRGCGPFGAMAASWRLSRGHFFGLLVVTLLLGLINVAGLFVVGVGLLFSLSFTEMVATSGYLLAGGSTPPIPLEYDPDEGPASRFRGVFSQRKRRP